MNNNPFVGSQPQDPQAFFPHSLETVWRSPGLKRAATAISIGTTRTARMDRAGCFRVVIPGLDPR